MLSRLDFLKGAIVAALGALGIGAAAGTKAAKGTEAVGEYGVRALGDIRAGEPVVLVQRKTWATRVCGWRVTCHFDGRFPSCDVGFTYRAEDWQDIYIRLCEAFRAVGHEGIVQGRLYALPEPINLDHGFTHLLREYRFFALSLELGAEICRRLGIPMLGEILEGS